MSSSGSNVITRMSQAYRRRPGAGSGGVASGLCKSPEYRGSSRWPAGSPGRLSRPPDMLTVSAVTRAEGAAPGGSFAT
jgi:hypothetical protein